MMATVIKRSHATPPRDAVPLSLGADWQPRHVEKW